MLHVVPNGINRVVPSRCRHIMSSCPLILVMHLVCPVEGSGVAAKSSYPRGGKGLLHTDLVGAVWLDCVAPLRLLSATLMAYEASSSVTKRDAGDWPLT